MKNRAFVLLVAIVLVILVVMMGCGGKTNTTPPTTTTTTHSNSTTPPTTTPPTTTPPTTNTTTPPTTTPPTTTPPTTTPPTTTPPTTTGGVPLLTTVGHDLYVGARTPVCLLCHDIGKKEELPANHSGGLPPLLTEALCLVCHQLGDVPPTPPLPTPAVLGGVPPLVTTHPVEAPYKNCLLCHIVGTKGSDLQLTEAHACDQCHYTVPQPFRDTEDCQHRDPIENQCYLCHYIIASGGMVQVVE